MQNIKSIGLKNRSDLHLARKAWHLVGVLSIAYFHTIISRPTALILLGFATAFVYSIDLIRQVSPKLNDFVVHAFRGIMRQGEVDKLSGNTYLLAGVFTIVFLFPPVIVQLTLLFLAFADPIASLIGVKYGRDKIWGNKSLQGFLAALFVCTILTLIYCSYHNLMSNRIFAVSLSAGLVGALSELIQIGKLDDNLTLPIISASGLYGLFLIFGGF